MHLKKLFGTAVMCAALIAGQAFTKQAAAADEFEDFDEEAPPEWIRYVPSTSYWGLRGLHHTVSAEPLGAGRFNLSLFFSHYKQEQESPLILSPGKDASVVTSRLALSWGLNDEMDVFGIIPYYFFNPDIEGRRNLDANFGGIMGGIQFSMPMPKEQPFRLGLQVMISSGIRKNDATDEDITTNNAYTRGAEWFRDGPNHDGHGKDNGSYAGYDFWDARKRDHIDLVGKLPISFVWGGLDRGFKWHINPGLMVTPGFDKHLFLFGTGLQYDFTESFTGGVEINWRTLLDGPTFEDPLWLTPSFAYRTPYWSEGFFGMSVVLGADINLAAAKDVSIYREGDHYFTRQNDDNSRTLVGTDRLRPLEPWRIFGDIVFSFDRYASYRAGLEEEKRRSAAERERLRRGVQAASAERDEIARRAHADSLRLAREMAERAHADSLRAQHIADSLAAEMGDLADRARQDSIAQAQAAAAREAELHAEAAAQRAADSLALLEAQRKLDEERANRSEAEKMLLSTGMLVLDAVYFQTGQAIIHRNSEPYLTIIAKMLAKYPKLKIEIGGHTDNTGSLQTNMRLSQQRAEAVFSFMARIEPVLAQMLSAKGYGPTVPKADNNTATGREMNRRVELKVLNPEVLQEYNP